MLILDSKGWTLRLTFAQVFSTYEWRCYLSNFTAVWILKKVSSRSRHSLATFCQESASKKKVDSADSASLYQCSQHCFIFNEARKINAIRQEMYLYDETKAIKSPTLNRWLNNDHILKKFSSGIGCWNNGEMCKKERRCIDQILIFEKLSKTWRKCVQAAPSKAASTESVSVKALTKRSHWLTSAW